MDKTDEAETNRCEHGPWYEEYKTRFQRANTELAEQEPTKADEDE
jgi:hypothetical protein